MVKLRGGTNRVRIEKERYRKEKVEERICVFCEKKETEDEKHFMLRCSAYTAQREKMWEEYETITQVRRDSLDSEDKQLAALIGDAHQPEEEEDKESERTKVYTNIVNRVMIYITSAMRKRRRMEQEASVKSLRGDAAHFATCSREN